jgi:predicted transcriptional regulator YdeE
MLRRGCPPRLDEPWGADAPDFERYGEDFDAQTGLGGVEIWLPLSA